MHHSRAEADGHATVRLMSLAEYHCRSGGPADARGINSIQLVHDGARWWIVSWVYDRERPGNEIPVQYLPGRDGSR